MIAPQIDTAIFGELYTIYGKKKLDNLFKINRARNAINALMREDLHEGIGQRAFLTHYLGDSVGALNYLEFNLKKYGSVESFYRKYVAIAFDYGDYQKSKEAIRLYLENVEDPEEAVLEVIKRWMFVYLHSEEKFIDSVDFEDPVAIQKINLDKIGVSVDTYRQVLFFAHQVFNSEWNGTLAISNNFTDYDVTLSFDVDNATPQDTRKLSNDLHNLILSSDDQSFLNEAEKIVTYFTIYREETVVA